MHPAVERMLRNFEFDHLPSHLQAVSQPLCSLAHEIVDRLPTDDPETTAGLRKLLEAKDCFVRAAVEQQRRSGG